MKRIMMLATAVVILASAILFAACSNSEKTDETTAETQEETVVETTVEATPTPEPTNTPTPTVYSVDGDYIVFGRYEQDGNLDNGPEPIEWEIVREEDGRMLLISRYILDCKPYNTACTDVTWETCSLRIWLNEDFLNTAFNASELEQILTVTNSNPDNDSNPNNAGIEGGNDTEDRVFCLSEEEVYDNYDYEEWSEDDQYVYVHGLIVEPTQFAIEQGAWINENTGCGDWWLRSPGVFDGRSPYGVSDRDAWYLGCFSCEGLLGVRPALYLNNQ